MPEPYLKHRPILAGVEIAPGLVGRGSLAGLAVLDSDDNEKILVTNAHVLSSGDDEDGKFLMPTRDRVMYQGNEHDDDDIVGRDCHWVELREGPLGNNAVDLAYVVLNDDLDDNEGALFDLHDFSHDHPLSNGHKKRTVIRGTRSPRVNDEVRALGKRTGEKVGRITDTTATGWFGGYYFKNLISIDVRSWSGDSGGPLVYEEPDGSYRMVGIVFGSDLVTGRPTYAFPASVAETMLAFKFGHQLPTANAGGNQIVNPNSTVDLNGATSQGYDGPLTYLWEQEFPRAILDPEEERVEVSITNADGRLANFTMPENVDEVFIRLTVTDSYEFNSVDRVTITANQPPVAIAGFDQQVGRSARVRLSGTAEDLDTGQVLTHTWTKVYGPSVILRDDDTLTPYFDAPDESSIFIWRLTVRDPLELEHSDNVWVFVDYTPDTQWQDWVPVVPPRYQGSGALREQHHTRAGVYLLPPIDREGNPISDRIPASSGGSSTTRSSRRSTVPGAYVPFVADPFNPGRPDPELDWFPAPEPWANAGPDQTVNTGETVDLTGSAGGYEEGEHVVLAWAQRQGPRVTLSTLLGASPSFTAPAEPTVLRFELLPTSITRNLTLAIDSVTITVNAPPVAEAGENAYVEVNTAAPLDASGSSDEDHERDQLSFLWQAPPESGATILNPDNMVTSFLAPSTPGDIVFTLTVTDPLDATGTDTVTKMVRVFTWTKWQDIVPLETRVSLLNLDEFEKKQFRTSNYNTIQHQWVPYVPPTWEPSGEYRCHEGNRERELFLRDADGNITSRRWEILEPIEWGDWLFVRYIYDTVPRRREDIRHTNYPSHNCSETRIVDDPEPITEDWSPWVNVSPAEYQLSADDEDVEALQTRYDRNNTANVQKMWNFDRTVVEGEVWTDNWTSTTHTRGSGAAQELLWQRFSNLGNPLTEWRPDPQGPDWSSWVNVSPAEYRLANDDEDIEVLQTRYDRNNTANVQKMWNFDRTVAEGEVWTDNWTSTAHTRGSGASQELLWQRFSNLGNPLTEWRPDPQGPDWSPWQDVSPAEYRLANDDEDIEVLQTRHNRNPNPVPRQTLWSFYRLVAAGETWSPDGWTGSDHYRGSGANRMRLWQNYSNQGQAITEWRPAVIPPPLEAEAGPNQSVDGHSMVHLDGSGSTGAQSYSWEKTDGPHVNLIDANTATARFVAPNRNTTITLQLTVTADGRSDTDTVVITVSYVAPPPCVWSQWSPTGFYKCEDGHRWQQQLRHCEDDLAITEERWVDQGTLIWGNWQNTGVYRRVLGEREQQQTRSTTYTSHNCTETQWVADPVPEVCDENGWTAVEPPVYDGIGLARKRLWECTTNYGNRRTKWEPDPVDPDIPGECADWSIWSSTGVYKCEGGNRWQQQLRHCEDDLAITETRWVDQGTLSWGVWQNTGDYRGLLGDREQKQTRSTTYTSYNCTETQWVPDPVPEVCDENGWTAVEPPVYDGIGLVRKRLWECTTNYGNRRTKWEPDPVDPDIPGECADWSIWSSTGVYKNENGRRYQQQQRHCEDDLAITETRWVDQGPLSWGAWTFVRHEGSGASRVRVESRTTTYSSYNTTEYRRIDDPPPPPFGTWADTGVYKNENGHRYKQQSRTNGISTQTKWVDQGALSWGAWTFVRYEGSGASRVRVESRTTTYSSYNTTEYRRIDDPPPPPFGTWADTGVYKNENGHRYKQQSRTNGISTQTKWVDQGALSWGAWTFVRYEGSGASRVRVESRTTTYSSYNTTEYRRIDDPPPPPFGTWADTGVYKNENGHRYKQQNRTNGISTQTKWVDQGALSWGAWTFVRYEGSGASRVRVEQRTTTYSSYNSTETRRVDAPVIIWGEWEDTGQDLIEDGWYWKHQSRTSNQNDVEYRWVRVEEITWGAWTDTGETRINPDDDGEIQKQQKRTPNYGNPEYRWVFDRFVQVGETWGPWTDTGENKIEGGWYWKEQVSHSNLGNSKTQWVKVAEITWGGWIDTGNYRTNPEDHEEEQKEQRRTPNYGDVEYRWVFHRFIPDDEVWEPWSPTNNYRGTLADRERQWERSSNLGGYQTEWRSDPEPVVWSAWSDTGRTRGTGASREKEQSRTSNYGNTETRWVADPVTTETWGSWTNTSVYRNSGGRRERKQTRTSSLSNTQTRWVDQGALNWGAWTDTGEYRNSLAARDQKQTRSTTYSSYNSTETRWVSDPEPETWGRWIDTGEYRENPDTFITEYEQKRTSNYGNVEYRWVE